MKIIKVVIAFIFIVSLLVMFLSFSSSAEKILEKIIGTSQGSDNNLLEEPGDNENEESTDNDIVLDDPVSDVSEGATLVWSEDFEDFSFNVTTDTDGNNVYSSNNYLVYYDDSVEADRLDTIILDDNSWLIICPSPNSSTDFENKPNVQLAFDFTGNFNKENLALNDKKFIVFEFTYGAMLNGTYELTDIIYYRYNITSTDGEKISVISDALSWSGEGFNGIYQPINLGQGGSKIVALIALDDVIENSDLYYFIDNTDQVVVQENFLKTNSSYIGSFEILFVDPTFVNGQYYDNFKLYTFSSDYVGNISNVLKEINFIN